MLGFASIGELTFGGLGHAGAVIILTGNQVAVSSGSACNTGNIKPSTVLSEMGIKKEINLSTLRFSFGKDNTKKEVDTLLKALKEII